MDFQILIYSKITIAMQRNRLALTLIDLNVRKKLDYQVDLKVYCTVYQHRLYLLQEQKSVMQCRVANCFTNDLLNFRPCRRRNIRAVFRLVGNSYWEVY